MRKIGFLIYSLGGGGAERMVSRLANGFVRKGIQTTIIVFSDDNIAYEISPEVQIIRCTDYRANRISRIACAIRRIRKIVKQEKIDILLAFTASMPPYALLAAAGLPCKVIGAERANPRSLEKKCQVGLKLITPFCDGYIFQTQSAKEYYPASVQKKSTVIGNITPNIEQCRTERRKNAICAVGRLVKAKDFAMLLCAMQQVREANPQATLTIFGDGEQREALSVLAERLGIADAVFFEGFVKNVTERIQEYAVFAFSEREAGMPNVLLEAMAAGLPCVATDCDFGPRDLIQDGRNGFLVPVGDSERMAQRILELLADEALRSSMGKEAAKVRECYSEEAITQKYLDYIEGVLEKKYY